MNKSKVLIFFLLVSCSPKTELQNEKNKLLKINEEQRTAHMTNDAEMLVRSMADSLISVDSGNISVNSKEQVQNRFNNYFSMVKYVEWDDLSEPLIEISDDGSLATMSVKKRTIILDNSGTEDTTIFAWTSAFKKIGDDWKMFSITSTNKH